MTSPMEGVDSQTGPAEQRAPRGTETREVFPLPYLQELSAWSSGGLTCGQRRRLLRDVNEACRAVNWMHGEDSRPTALPPSLVASEDKNLCLRADVQQRVVSSKQFCVGLMLTAPPAFMGTRGSATDFLRRQTFFSRSFSHGCCDHRR